MLDTLDFVDLDLLVQCVVASFWLFVKYWTGMELASLKSATHNNFEVIDTVPGGSAVPKTA